MAKKRKIYKWLKQLSSNKGDNISNRKMTLGEKIKKIAKTANWKLIAGLECVPLGGELLGKYLSGQLDVSLTGKDFIEIGAEMLAIGGLGLYFSHLYETSIRDSLTGLYNDRYYRKNREKILKKTQKDKQNTMCVLVDLKGFKSVNDEYGFEKGNKVIKEFSTILSSSVRPGDEVCRIGGDEFFIFLKNSDETGGERFLKRLENRVYMHTTSKEARQRKEDKKEELIGYSFPIHHTHFFRSYQSTEPLNEFINRIDKMELEGKQRKRGTEY